MFDIKSKKTLYQKKSTLVYSYKSTTVSSNRKESVESEIEWFFEREKIKTIMEY